MIELRRRHYPEPWGRPSQGEQEALEAIVAGRHPRLFRSATIVPNGTILGVAGRFDWEPLEDLVGRLLGDWQPQPAAGRSSRSPPAKKYHHLALRFQPDADRHRLPQRALPPSRLFPGLGRRWACSSGGMSARLFTEVREKRGLCYSVYASYHTLRDRGAVFCYAGTSAERAQETLDVTLGELVRLAEGIEDARAGPAQGPHQERADHAAGIEFRAQLVASPATGITWAARGRWTRWAGWSTA